VLAVAVLVAAPPAAGGEAHGPTGALSDEPGAGISTALAAVPVDSLAYRRVADEVMEVESRQASAQAALADAAARIDQLTARAAQLETELDAAEVALRRAARRRAAAESSLQASAVDAYVQAGAQQGPSLVVEPAEADDELARAALAGTVRRHHLDEHADATADHAAARERRDDLQDEASRVAGELDTANADRTAAEGDLAAAEDDLLVAQVGLDDAWRTANVVGSDLPLVALDAYWRAARTINDEDPGCGIRWTALAGISRVEGRHGSFGSSELGADGVASPPILGIPLDGTSGTRVINDTDGGALDGDPSIDRAVGPMQFIPSTWVRWAHDGTGDGDADPHNLYDAALTAAAYLCQSGPGLDGEAGLRRAFFSYNHSQAYVDRVLGFVSQYASLGL
jgi:membrane-bound lytic murein transglycosylase B